MRTLKQRFWRAMLPGLLITASGVAALVGVAAFGYLLG